MKIMGIKKSIMKDPVFENKRRNTLLYAIRHALSEAAGIEMDLQISYVDLNKDSYTAVRMTDKIKEIGDLEERLAYLITDVEADVSNHHCDECYQEYMALYTVLQMLSR